MPHPEKSNVFVLAWRALAQSPGKQALLGGALVFFLWACWPWMTATKMTPHAMDQAKGVTEEAARAAAWVGKSPIQGASSPTAVASAPVEETAVVTPRVITTEQMGQVGDMFGSLNTLFAGWAFIGVAVAAIYQRKSFETQTQQLQDAQAQQALAEFEPLFFQLLTVFRELHTAAITSPQSGFSPAARIRREMTPSSFAEQSTPPATFDAAYREVSNDEEAHLAPMFRLLHQILGLIRRSELSEDQKSAYANIARDLLNEDLLLLIMGNALSEEGKHFKPYIEYFGLLKHVRAERHKLYPDREIAETRFTEAARLGKAKRDALWEASPDLRPSIHPGLQQPFDSRSHR